MRILLVDDDREISSSLKVILEREMFAVDIANDFTQGFEKSLIEDYDLMIFDWMLPDGDGSQLCRKVRAENVNTPILMLTAKGLPEDIVEALDAGADDYLPKPFELKVFLARVRALLRRKETFKPEVIKKDNLEIDLTQRKVVKEKRIVNLTPKEFGLLEYLIKNQERIIDRAELLSHVWDENADPFSNIIDVHIRYIRRKIGKDLVKTIRGKGYQINL